MHSFYIRSCGGNPATIAEEASIVLTHDHDDRGMAKSGLHSMYLSNATQNGEYEIIESCN